MKRSRGEDGERIFTVNVYEVNDGRKVEIRDGKVIEFSGTLPVEVQVKKEKVFKETELKKGFLNQNMKDAMQVLGFGLQGATRIGALAAGL